MNKRDIPDYIDVIKEHGDPCKLPSATHVTAARQEIKALREYIKELEDFRDQVSELPEAFKVYTPVLTKPILVESLIVAQAIQDSIPKTKIIPLYSYLRSKSCTNNISGVCNLYNLQCDDSGCEKYATNGNF